MSNKDEVKEMILENVDVLASKIDATFIRNIIGNVLMPPKTFIFPEQESLIEEFDVREFISNKNVPIYISSMDGENTIVREFGKHTRQEENIKLKYSKEMNGASTGAVMESIKKFGNKKMVVSIATIFNLLVLWSESKNVPISTEVGNYFFLNRSRRDYNDVCLFTLSYSALHSKWDMHSSSIDTSLHISNSHKPVSWGKSQVFWPFD